MPNDEDDSSTFSTASPARLRRERADESISTQIENCISTCRHYGERAIAERLEAILERFARPEDVEPIVCPRCACVVEHECVGA